MVPLSQEAEEDLKWWCQNLHLVNGQLIQRDQPSLSITSDASLKGWGAWCSNIRIGGPWTVEESRNLINFGINNPLHVRRTHCRAHEACHSIHTR